MAALRATWQSFKKAHPSFEKNKNFKNDVGPQFDAYEKLGLSILKEANAIEPLLKSLEKKEDELDKAWDGYLGHAASLAREDASDENKAILKDLEKLREAISNRIERASERQSRVYKILSNLKLS